MARRKDFSTLGLENDFIFYKTLEQNSELCKELIEIITNHKVKSIGRVDGQKTIKVTVTSKGIRMDVRFVDDKGTEYNLEMQTTKAINLRKRTRYYQAIMDINHLGDGSDYTALGTTYIIFICTFDPFGKDRYVYTFENTCAEDETLKLGDGAKKIFLNTKGTEGNISNKLLNFLQYVGGSSAGDEFTRRLDREVQSIRRNEKWRTEYMKFEADLMDERREGKREGLAEGVEIATFESVRDGDFTPERGAQKLGLKLSDFLKKMDRAGYKVPSMA